MEQRIESLVVGICFFLAKLEIKCNGLHISDDAAFIPV